MQKHMPSYSEPTRWADCRDTYPPHSPSRPSPWKADSHAQNTWTPSVPFPWWQSVSNSITETMRWIIENTVFRKNLDAITKLPTFETWLMAWPVACRALGWAGKVWLPSYLGDLMCVGCLQMDWLRAGVSQGQHRVCSFITPASGCAWQLSWWDVL